MADQGPLHGLLVNGVPYDSELPADEIFKDLLASIRDSDLPEEVKLRRVNHLRTKVFPFWDTCVGYHERESEEIIQVYLKYNGPRGIRENNAKRYGEIKDEIIASDDAILLEEMEKYNPCPLSIVGRRELNYGRYGHIIYNIDQNPFGLPTEEELKDRAPREPKVRGAFGGGPLHHHNINEDDDMSLKKPLLNIVRRLMSYSAIVLPFIDPVNRTRALRMIEQWLMTRDSWGYGPTACFNDMHLVLHNRRYYFAHDWHRTRFADMLEDEFEAYLAEIEPGGEQLLGHYKAVVELGPEDWPDPEWIFKLPKNNPSSPLFEGKIPDVNIDALRWEQFESGQDRVKELQSRMAAAASGTRERTPETNVESSAQLEDASRKQPREEVHSPVEGGAASRGAKRQRSNRSVSHPSSSATVPPKKATGKRSRKNPEDDGDDGEVGVDESQAPGASKRQRLMKEKVPPGAPGSTSRAVNPPKLVLKRPREAVNDGSEGEDEGQRNGRFPAGSKRQRVMKRPPPASVPIAGPEAGPSKPKPVPQEAKKTAPGHAISTAGQQPVKQPTGYALPASEPLKSSRNTITMSKVAKMGKKRPWLFGYRTSEGYGVYAFVSCPKDNCKHHFSRHPLCDDRAQDHFLACNQPSRDEQHMVLDLACQVIKDPGRKSDLTIDWARKSNITLLPPDLKADHPENFPHPPAEKEARR